MSSHEYVHTGEPDPKTSRLPEEASGATMLDSKGVRKILVAGLSEVLKDFGFKKTGHSLWTRKIGSKFHLVYLQRAMFIHSYYVEFGMCEEDEIPPGKKPDVIYCGRESQRIEHVVIDETADQQARKSIRDQVNATLDFNGPEERSGYPLDKTIAQSEALQRYVRERVPLWFGPVG